MGRCVAARSERHVDRLPRPEHRLVAGGALPRGADRVEFGESDKPWTALTLPFVGFGVFVMTQRQMLGIKERAETLTRERSMAEGPPSEDETVRVEVEAAAASALS